MSEPAKVWKELDFQPETCITCGVIFGVGLKYHQWRVKDQAFFYCPNGHSQRYCGETPEQKLQRDLDAAKRDADWQRQLHEKADKKLRRIEQRINRGVCPHCNRTFENVARHMHTKHAAEEREAALRKALDAFNYCNCEAGTKLFNDNPANHLPDCAFRRCQQALAATPTGRLARMESDIIDHVRSALTRINESGVSAQCVNDLRGVISIIESN